VGPFYLPIHTPDPGPVSLPISIYRDITAFHGQIAALHGVVVILQYGIARLHHGRASGSKKHISRYD